jgi:lambda family phage portal protein
MSARVIPLARYEAGQSSPYHPNPPASRSADWEYSSAGRTLRDWARHLADNSSVVSAVLSSRVSNAIGAGLTYEPLVRDRKGNLLPEVNDALRRIHQQWSRSPDVTGELSRPELERLAWRTWDVDGEAFIRRVARRPDNRRESLPYLLQLLETDWVPHNLTHDRNGRTIIHGVEKDEWGRPLRYFIDPRPLDLYTLPGVTLDPAKLISIDAADLWHLKRVQRPAQTRGVTLLHAVIFRISDIAEFQQAHRLAARASADLFASVNRSPEVDPDTSEANKRTWQFEHLQILDELLPGESVNFHSPQHPNQNAVDFVREELRAIAAGCDVGFSQIAQVFDSSYAAQRLEVVDTWRKVERDRAKFISDFARPALYERPIEAALMTQQLPARALRRADPQTLLDVRIDGPTMPVIDPVKDRAAFELDQINGWDSRHGIIRRMGRNPQDVDAERRTDSDSPADPLAPAPREDTQDDDEQQPV